MNKTDKIFVAGHNGMVGSAIVRSLKAQEFDNIILQNSSDLDLRNPEVVESFFTIYKPEIVILAAARVGGIQANIDRPAEFLHENLVIQNNVIHQAYLRNVKKFCFLGSSCIYPKECPQPMKEEFLLTGLLEPTNEGYALAKIVGLKMIEYYRKQYGFPGISVMPCNLYGTNDSFDPLHSHVLSSLVKRFVDAVDNDDKNVTIWGAGIARREFMHVDDVASAIIHLIANYDFSQFVNVGWGEDISIKDLASLISLNTGYTGTISWDTTKPEGMLRKCLDVSKMEKNGYLPHITLEEGVRKTIQEYKKIKKDETFQ